ncbi:MAG: enoyl-CoA hydratase/isomerase family protein [Oligoflexia bacterium]|nr:enoyl-CoA hydratase/isomerase family protein [Oligoflexia bacterium]
MPNEKANKLSSGVLLRLHEVIEELGKSKFKAAIFVSKKPNIFIAGADIEEIKNLKTAQDAENACLVGQTIFSALEVLKIPTIAAIHGACVGGGCEMVLACDYRICSDDPATKIGLPEIQLGVIPGFGGTQRLPRLVGAINALDIILAGKSVDARKAAKIGLVDQAVPKEILLSKARDLALTIIKDGSKKKPQKFKAKSMGESFLNGMGSFIVFNKAKKTVLAQTKGHYPAPLKALEVIRKTYGGDQAKGFEIEAHGFGEVAQTDVSKNLINLFFMMEGVKKQTGVTSDEKGVPVNQIGVLGAGTMGGGIAQLAAERDMQVRLKDITYDAIGKGLKAANDIFKKSVQRKKMTSFDFKRKMGLISGTLDYSGFKTLDVVIEAIVEDMNVKKKVLADMVKSCREDVIIASNTSSLSITEMATAVPHPENFVGMHFFNPVNKMPLIEVIRGEKTSDRAAATVFALSKKMGKTPIIVKDGPGFLVNRLLLPYLNEACFTLGDGASIEFIDKACLKFGMPMGPLHLIDEVGIDVSAKVAKILGHAFGVRAEAAPLMSKVVDAKKLGKKNGSGFYFYDSQGKKLDVDQNIYQLTGLPKPKNPFSEEEIIHRVLFPMINEAALCLEEGIVTTPEAVDLGMIMGTGFPPFRGGLLRWADSIGSAKVVDELEIMATKFGPRFKPSNPLRNMAKTNRTFYKQ